MSIAIRELRASTGLTQKAFSDKYGIPLSTLRKWEQGESSPAPYVVQLLARSLPGTSSGYQTISGKDGTLYYYDKKQSCVLDVYGNRIFIQENLDGVKEQNLPIYLQDLFERFYEIQDRFNQDCRYDKEDDIIWT